MLVKRSGFIAFEPGERIYSAKGEPSFLSYVCEDAEHVGVTKKTGKPFRKRKIFCKCDYEGCGNVKSFVLSNIRSGVTVTCGHENYRVKRIGGALSKHGCGKSPDYHIWVGVKSRCCNPRHEDYKPVTLHPQWYHPREFLSYIRSLPPEKQAGPGKRLRRINPREGFVPGNIEFRSCKIGSSS